MQPVISQLRALRVCFEIREDQRLGANSVLKNTTSDVLRLEQGR